MVLIQIKGILIMSFAKFIVGGIVAAVAAPIVAIVTAPFTLPTAAIVSVATIVAANKLKGD
jgi:hypothetical protein